ncbi:MAG: thioredoxin domain-containing protein, partial [Bryobacteraceae bacterium]
VSYLEAYQITGDAFFAGVARRTLDYVLRDMTDREGGFYSAEDADSVVDPAKPKEKSEGAYYIWRHSEIETLLGEEAARRFGRHYGVEPDGNVREDPHSEFTGRNILFEAQPSGDDEDLAEARAKLLAARSRRVRPHLDDKVLTAWNGLMISALAKGGAILAEPRYLAAASRAAGFILTRLYDPKRGGLLRRYRAGESAIPGFLDDYAFFVQGLLDLYEASFHLTHLQQAVRLTEKQIALFADEKAGGFFSAAPGDASLVLRIKEDYDGAEPAGNSVAALNLLRLAQITDRKDFREHADRLLRAFSRRVAASPLTAPQLLVAGDFRLAKPKQIILAGDPHADDTALLLRRLHERFVPGRIVLLLNDESRSYLAGYLPVIENMSRLGGRATAYVCEDYACKLPTADPDKFADLLSAK